MICKKHPKYKGLREPKTKLTFTDGCNCRNWWEIKKRAESYVDFLRSNDLSEINEMKERIKYLEDKLDVSFEPPECQPVQRVLHGPKRSLKSIFLFGN